MRTRSERGYDRLAFAYQTIERMVFLGQLQSARVALLDELPPWQRMLILGDGDGRLLQSIVNEMQDHSDQTILSVDHSQAMLIRQKRRVVHQPVSQQIEWIKADALSFVPDPCSFDVIVTPFFLDCFTEEQLRAALPKWLSGLRQEGRWYYVDFVLPESGWWRLGAIGLSRTMHWFFRWMTGLPNAQLLNVPAMLRKFGLVREHQADRFGGMIATEIYGRVGSVSGEPPKN